MVLERLAAVETAQDEVVAHFLAIIGKARLGTSAHCVAARHRCKPSGFAMAISLSDFEMVQHVAATPLGRSG